jgi:hypothetical protein
MKKMQKIVKKFKKFEFFSLFSAFSPPKCPSKTPGPKRNIIDVCQTAGYLGCRG